MIMEKTYYYGQLNNHFEAKPQLISMERTLGNTLEYANAPARLKQAVSRLKRSGRYQPLTKDTFWRRYSRKYLPAFELTPQNLGLVEYYFKKYLDEYQGMRAKFLLALVYLHSSHSILEVLQGFRANSTVFRQFVAELSRHGIKSMRRPVSCLTLILNFFAEQKIMITLEYKRKMLLYLHHTKTRAYNPRVRAAAICYALVKWDHLASQKTLAKYFDVSTVGLRMMWQRLEKLKDGL